jgi:exoribonuclease-2
MANNKFDLLRSAREEMVRQGFAPDFPPEVAAELQHLQQPRPDAGSLKDLRNLPWSSIDNSTSKDLDQIECAERQADVIRVLVAIADVDALVRAGSAVDNYARSEATSVYTPGHVFPMLPEALSTDRSSLGEGQERSAVVIELHVATDGTMQHSDVFQARVKNRAQLSYGRVGPWLERRGPAPDSVAESPELQDQLRLQDEAAERLRSQRHHLGALEFDREEPVPIVVDGQVQRIEIRQKNRAADLIEDFMIAANEVIAETITASGRSGIRRVVKSPERWPRIVTLAESYGSTLPQQPDSGALAQFLREQKTKDPEHFPDLSLSVMKLMGPGEYVVVRPGETNAGHFGLATLDYTHSTAPNRRFADLVTQRVIKALLAGTPAPYTDDELEAMARHCTLREDAARKVERAMRKRAAAFALRSRVGQTFRALITGVTPKGTFARVFDPPVEGRVVKGEKGLDVGDRVKLTLLKTDADQGWIDFGR